MLLVGLFALDLLVIHPFEDGNGRVARALTNALLMDAGLLGLPVCQLEQQIAQSADAYYQALLDSTHDWHDGQADPWPWLGYFVDVPRARTASSPNVRHRTGRTAPSRTGYGTTCSTTLHPLPRVSDIRTALPGISDPTIRVVLDRLRREGAVASEGLGRAAAWRRTSS